MVLEHSGVECHTGKSAQSGILCLLACAPHSVPSRAGVDVYIKLTQGEPQMESRPPSYRIPATPV